MSGLLYGGGPAGLTTIATTACPVCGWSGQGRDAPFHDCKLLEGRSMSDPVHSTSTPCPECGCDPSAPWGCGCSNEDCPCFESGDE